MAVLRSKAAVVLATRVQGSQGDKAIRIGVSRLTMNRWETGRTRPPDELRAKIKELWGIPEAAWELLPSDPDPEGMPTFPRDAPPLLDDEELGAASQGVEGRVNELERALQELMAEVQTSEGTTARERATVLETVTRTIGQIAKMKGTYELGARLFKLPVYQRLEATLLEVLKPWPDAMRAVAEALERIEEEYGR